MSKSPMMKQYSEMKEKYGGYLLFFRLGDFYELFYEDAHIGARELDLVLTGKDCGGGERAPMCGMPHHSIDTYISRLIEKGYKIAVCEQLEDPALAKGIVKRDVVRVITPGTVIESGFLNEKKNNYLAAVCVEKNRAGAAFIDITAGIIDAAEFHDGDFLHRLLNEIGMFAPSEVILNTDKSKIYTIASFITEKLGGIINDNEESLFDYGKAIENIARCFPDQDVSNFPEPAVAAVGALINYLKFTKKDEDLHLSALNICEQQNFLELDVSTLRNLEVTETIRGRKKEASLLWVLDKTKTAKGARLLRTWIERPLRNCAVIIKRQNAVKGLLDKPIERDKIAQCLSQISDIDKIVTKILYRTANVRDMRRLADCFLNVPKIKELLNSFDDAYLREINDGLDGVEDIIDEINFALNDDIPANPADGGYIRDGYDAKIDRLRAILNDSKNWLEKFENEERRRTQIKNLKINYNKVFGYYIEVTKSYLASVPERYERKQTLANCERFITKELKEAEQSILTASDELLKLEKAVLTRFENAIITEVRRFQKTSYNLSVLDVLYSFAETAEKNSYVCPEVDYSKIIDIRDGRHPVVEKMAESEYFVPNDVYLDIESNRLYIITGPNMAGKSTYMRQVAVTVLMAQTGSFVPARAARIGLVDKIFTRVGASDDLSAGQSTFMVEMSEVANIIKNATQSSLIIYDEIGRGTSTYDGMSIARAILEYTAGKKLGAKTLFATHYHELTELEEKIEGVKNYNITAKKKKDDIIFLRKIVRGAADDSYGIEVAKLAGVKAEIVERAKEILHALENSGDPDKSKRALYKNSAAFDDDLQSDNLSVFDMAKDELYEKIKKIDIDSVSPREAFNILYELKAGIL